ncbi:hypothetical protein CRG98_033305 [Punica granatum]|uniref:Uncharacterized protein n=1 Tax=Punica granatum TaxID=22663 RepID=A0A2I0IS77_PUNGR|nr:hypothetical protein CRG98_033305 [Punica granatum]
MESLLSALGTGVTVGVELLDAMLAAMESRCLTRENWLQWRRLQRRSLIPKWRNIMLRPNNRSLQRRDAGDDATIIDPDTDAVAVKVIGDTIDSTASADVFILTGDL